MSIRPFRPTIWGEVCSPCDRDDQALNALATVGALVALADGRVETTERHEVVGYIHERRLAPTVTLQRITKFFDERVRDLQDRDFVHLITAALRPLPGLSLATDVIRIAERTAAADGQVDRNEAQVVRLIRLIAMGFAEPKLVEPCHGAADDRIKRS